MSLVTSQINCLTCSVRHLCIPKSLNEKEIRKLDSIIECSKPIQKGEFLFFDGSPLNALYAIRSGTIKSYTLNDQATEKIIAFHLAGEVLGLDAITAKKHCNFASTLETSMICKIPYQKLTLLALSCPPLHKKLFRLLSKEIQSVQNILLLHSQKSSEQRLAYFIYNMSNEYALRGFSSKGFKLSMARKEIANYLGLAIETTSRLLSRFRKEGIITLSAQSIVILDMDAICLLAEINKPRYFCDDGLNAKRDMLN